MNTITQDVRFRLSLIKSSEKIGVTMLSGYKKEGFSFPPRIGRLAETL